MTIDEKNSRNIKLKPSLNLKVHKELVKLLLGTIHLRRPLVGGRGNIDFKMLWDGGGGSSFSIRRHKRKNKLQSKTNKQKK